MNKKLAVWMIGLIAMVLMASPAYAESDTQPLAIEAKFDEAYKFHEGLAAVKVGDKVGVIDRTGQFILEPRYNWIEDFKDGFAQVGQQPSETGYNRIGVIDKTGKEIIPPLYWSLDRMSNGYWKGRREDNGKYTLFDENGKQIGLYDYVGDFKDGLGDVSSFGKNHDNYKNGFIDETGKLIIPIQYDSISGFESGLTIAYKAGKKGAIDKKGKTVIPFQYDSISRIYDGDTASNYLAVIKNGKAGVIDTKGKTVVPLKYSTADAARFTPEGLMIYGTMRKTIVNWSEASDDGSTIVDAKGNRHTADWGAIDLRTGKTIVPAGYDRIRYMRNGLLDVCKSKQCGLVNLTGKFVLPMKYRYISDFPIETGGKGVNFYIAYTNSQLGIFNPAAPNSVKLFDYINLSSIFSFVEDYQEGLVRVIDKNKKMGLISMKGGEIVKAGKYDEIRGFTEGFAAVKLSGKYGLIDRTGKEIVKPQYSEVGYFHEGLVSVKKNGKFGYIDGTGKEVISPQFDQLNGGFSEGLAPVRINDKWGYVASPLSQ